MLTATFVLCVARDGETLVKSKNYDRSNRKEVDEKSTRSLLEQTREKGNLPSYIAI